MDSVSKYNGQAAQDYFVLKCLNFKKNGTFLEIGSNDPIKINNSYPLEKHYNWRGLMVEFDSKYLSSYKIHRPNSIHIIQDATTIDYKSVLTINKFPKNIDYLQIDLEASNGSTINTLENLNNNVMNEYKFAVVTFEHDIYGGDHHNTRNRSREIFMNHGYVRVFSDVDNGSDIYPDKYPFEDWYVHPDLVNMNYINKIINTRDSIRWGDIIKVLDSN